MEKISFLVTYYNQEKFVKDSLESIFALDIPCDFEVLVGDDGSTDETLNQVEKFQEKYPNKIKVFQMPREQDKTYNPIHRVAANRLNLVKKASGNYLLFLDGDDFYCNKIFLLDAIEQLSKNKNLIGAAFNFKYIYEDKETLPSKIPSNGILLAKEFIKKYYIHSGAIVFRNIFDEEKITFLENCKNFDDNVITIYFSQFGNFLYSNKIIYGYRQSANSIWNSFSEIEQNLLNAMDYENILKVVPKFKNYLFIRQYSALKNIYNNRLNLKKLLGDSKYNKYIEENENLNNYIIVSFLKWNTLKFMEKLKLFLWFKVISLFNYFRKYIG